MMKTALPLLAFALSAGMAQAQTPDAHAANARATRTAHEAGGPPGTLGAMASATYGLATSAQDVVLQQRGMSTMAQGGQPVAHIGVGRSVAAPGTVGAAPGSSPGE